jgi:hypothetical protein
MPERDTLWLGGGNETELDELMRLNRQQNERSRYPLSPAVYRLERGRLVTVSGAGPAAT